MYFRRTHRHRIHKLIRDVISGGARGLALVVAAVVALAFGSPALQADIVKNGKSCIPGHAGKVVKWRAAHSKTPYGNPVGKKDVHFWLDLELENPQPGDDVRFVVCAMLNVNKPKINMPAFKANVSGGEWTCTSDGNVSWYPNYHLGCKRVRLHAGNNWKRNTFDETVEFSVEFTESEIAAPYFDLAIDCPNGFSGCGPLFGQPDQFLTPGDGNFPHPDPNTGNCPFNNGTSSWWAYNGGTFNVDPNVRRAESPFHLGNWYTMAFPQQVYPSLLEGTLSNAPIGTEVEIRLPLSACRSPFTEEGECVERREVTDDPFPLEIPFVITEELIEEEDEHVHLLLTYPAELELPNPDEVIEFLGQVTATGPSSFPDGAPLFEPGDFMHGIQVQFAVEDDPPFVVQPSIRLRDDGRYEVRVSAADETTMATGASVRLLADAVTVAEAPMPFDEPASEGETTRFRAVLGPVDPGSAVDEYEIFLVDDAGNTSATTFPVPTTTACIPSPTRLCLNQGRFAVEVEWADFSGNRGPGNVISCGTDSPEDSGLFYFFSPSNWEMLVKVLDGCSVNGHFWVFAAATTNVEYTLRVLDTRTGAEQDYFNPLGRSAAAITDTSAFATCP